MKTLTIRQIRKLLSSNGITAEVTRCDFTIKGERAYCLRHRKINKEVYLILDDLEGHIEKERKK